MKRTTIALTNEAYNIARTVAYERHISLGEAISKFIEGAFSRITSSDSAKKNNKTTKSPFPTFECERRVTSVDVKSLDDEW